VSDSVLIKDVINKGVDRSQVIFMFDFFARTAPLDPMEYYADEEVNNCFFVLFYIKNSKTAFLS
jgi:hypothetical protein